MNLETVTEVRPLHKNTLHNTKHTWHTTLRHHPDFPTLTPTQALEFIKVQVKKGTVETFLKRARKSLGAQNPILGKSIGNFQELVEGG